MGLIEARLGFGALTHTMAVMRRVDGDVSGN